MLNIRRRWHTGLLLSKLLPVLVLVVVFIKLAQGVLTNSIITFDDTIINIIRHYTSPSMTAIMKSITFWGNTKTLILIGVSITALLFILLRRLTEVAFWVISSTSGWYLIEFLKELFHRPRPDENPLIPAWGYSFPSGHAMLSTIIYGAIAYLLWTCLPSTRVRGMITGFFALLILLVGMSRVYLGVHYPSDVLAGFAFGGAWLIICVAGKQIFERRPYR